MQAELLYRRTSSIMTSRQEVASTTQNLVSGVHRSKNENKDARETIHSGHFMVSDFEAEAQDDEDELAVPVPEEEAARLAIIAPTGFSLDRFVSSSSAEKNSQQLSIETSLNKLFQCMSLAYRQKLTSPKWNRFKGIRLRWKDKIRLNNVIWRCWHMQFILKQNTLVCQFASPLDVDTHNKPEAVVLEGKYWKRKLAAVTAEYKKWRMFYRNKILGWTNKDGTDMLESMDMLEWGSSLENSGTYDVGAGNSYGGNIGIPGGESVHSMLVDEDYMELMTDTLFSTISSNQPIYFPDPREIARGASLADFIQPSLGPLQPNLDDFMDTLEPLQEFLNSKLPPVPEEDDMFRSGQLNNNYPELDLITPINQVNDISESSSIVNQVSQPQQQPLPQEQQNVNLQQLQYTAKIYTQPQADSTNVFRNTVSSNNNFNPNQSSYESTQSLNTHESIREKSRQHKSQLRPSRSQQSQQQQLQSQQQTTYQPSAQHQNLPYQQTSQQQSYAINVQAVQLASTSSQMQQLPVLNDQTNANNISQMTASHMQGLIVSPQAYVQPSSQQKVIKPVTTPMIKPYKIIQQSPQQSYKFPAPTQNFSTPQFKFSNSNFKNKTPGLDLTSPALHPTKLLPRPASVNSEKEEVFAVPKYQMKARNRSRSSSSLTPSKVNPPPLLSAVSDPSLNLNNNALLAHLLTNNTSSLYTVSTDKIVPGVNQPISVKHALPMMSHEPSSAQVTNTTRHVTVPITAQTNIQQSVSTIQTQGQQAIQQTSAGSQVLLNKNSQTHQSQGSPGSPKDSSSAHSPQALSLSPLHSPMSIGSPLSPTRVFVKGEPERGQYKEQRRVGHIHAEQKRRYNIKNGFDMLHSLIPQLNQNPNTKLSKAAMLQKGADYIKQLRLERNQLKEEMDSLRHQIECLNTSISNCQSMLPATGAPISRHRTNKIKEMFDDYVRIRTRENWKFWIFSILLEPLLLSFNASVSTASVEDLYRSTLLWVEQHCSLVDLRPAVLNSLRYLCTATDILSDPARLPEEALVAVNRSERRSSMQ